MKGARVTLPELALIAGSRAALGVGVGLLLADRLPRDQRAAIAWTLLLIGGFSTIPLALKSSANFALPPFRKSRYPVRA